MKSFWQKSSSSLDFFTHFFKKLLQSGLGASHFFLRFLKDFLLTRKGGCEFVAASKIVAGFGTAVIRLFFIFSEETFLSKKTKFSNPG